MKGFPMPAPSSSLATLRPEIAGSLVEFDLAMDREGFIWNRVMPVFEVAVPSGIFGRIPVEQLLQNRDTARSPGSGYSRGKWTFQPDSYATFEHGAEEPIDDNEAKMYASYFDAETVSAQRALDAVLRNAEKRCAAAVFNPTTWSGASKTTAVVNEWDDHDNATPIDDVEAAVLKVWDGSGLWPTSLIITKHVFRNLRQCAQIIDRIASSGAGSATKASDITAAQLAAVFDLQEVIVAGGAKNSANEGQAVTFDKIWSDEYAMVARIDRSNDIRRPTLGRVFHWGADGSTVGGTIETYRDETVRADIVRARHQVSEKIMYTEAGHLLSNVSTN
jgi:hypothetical protein